MTREANLLYAAEFQVTSTGLRMWQNAGMPRTLWRIVRDLGPSESVPKLFLAALNSLN